MPLECARYQILQARKCTLFAVTDHRVIATLPYRPPLDWPALLDYLSLRAIPGVERVEGEHYRRTVSINGEAGRLRISRAKRRNALELAVEHLKPQALPEITGRVRAMFDLDADPETIAAHLQRDRRLAALVEAQPGLRVPGAWDGFELTVRAILGQQVTVKGASTLAGRLAGAFGEPLLGVGGDDPCVLFPTAAAIAANDPGAIGLPKARSRAILGLAQATCEASVRFDWDVEAAVFERQLTALPGIGAWTAQYVAMRARRQPDAFPATDLGLLRAAARLGIAETAVELEAQAESWRPWRAYAAMLLWRSEGGKNIQR